MEQTNLEKAINELLIGKKFKYKYRILYYSKNNWFPFVSENPDANMFEPREYAITNEQFENFSEWEEYKKDPVIENIKNGISGWCWVGDSRNIKCNMIVRIVGYKDHLYYDESGTSWKYISPISEEDLEIIRGELAC